VGVAAFIQDGDPILQHPLMSVGGDPVVDA
jgi:hypothetical protein